MARLRKRRKENLRVIKGNYREITDEEAEELNNRIIEYMRSRNNGKMALDDRPETDIGIFKIVHEFRAELVRRDKERAGQG
jgi:predicted RNA-binding protein (virulence factor B family)